MAKKLTPEQLAKKAAENKAYRDRRNARHDDAKKAAAELAEKLRVVKSRPVDLPPEERENREAWLGWAVEVLRPVFADRGYTLPEKIRVSLGWPRGRKTLGICFDSDHSTGGHVEIFISPLLDDSLEIFDILTHELCHAAVGCTHGHRKPFKTAATKLDLEGKATHARGYENPTWRGWAESLCSKLGPIPHDAMLAKQGGGDKQSTRLLKRECDECGFLIRTTQRWIDQVATQAPLVLRCPDSHCAGHLA